MARTEAERKSAHAEAQKRYRARQQMMKKGASREEAISAVPLNRATRKNPKSHAEAQRRYAERQKLIKSGVSKEEAYSRVPLRGPSRTFTQDPVTSAPPTPPTPSSSYSPSFYDSEDEDEEYITEESYTIEELIHIVEKESDLADYGGHIEDADSYMTNSGTYEYTDKNGKKQVRTYKEHERKRTNHPLREQTEGLIQYLNDFYDYISDSRKAKISEAVRDFLAREYMQYEGPSDMADYYEDRTDHIIELHAEISRAAGH